MCVVDLFRLYRNIDQSSLEWDSLKFADHMTANLFTVTERSAPLSIEDQGGERLEPIVENMGIEIELQQKNNKIMVKHLEMYLLNLALLAKNIRAQYAITALLGVALIVECQFV